MSHAESAEPVGYFDVRPKTESPTRRPAYAGPIGDRRSGTPVPLTVRELLGDTSLGLSLVAGGDGLDERGPIRWAHISDTPDPTPWLEGGELLLTTGLGVKDDRAAQRRLIANLTERGCVAVGFGVGVAVEAVPQGMLEEADARQLPLFTVPFEVPFIAVTRRVARAVFEEHYATLASAVDLHRQVLHTVIAGHGIERVLATTASHMPGAGFVVFDFSGTVLAHSGVSTEAGDLTGLWEELAPATAQRDRISLGFDARTVTGVVIRAGDEVEAVLAVITEGPPSEPDSLLIEQSVAGVSLELARGQSVREGRRVRVDELLEEAAAGRAGRQMVTRVLGRLGFPTPDAYRVLCVAPPPTARQRALCTLTEDVLAVNGCAVVVGRHDGDVFAVVQADLGDLPHLIADAMLARSWGDAPIGLSHRHDDPDGFGVAVREARTAAHTPAPGGDTVRDVAAIGLEGVLASVREGLGAEAFVQQVLGPVIAHDLDGSSDLVATVAAYLRHGCRPGPAADELSIHRHTLAYRLDRVRELTGRDPRDGTQLLAFSLALELLESP